MSVAAVSWLHYDEPMSLPDLIFIFLLALVVLGPKKLPEVARQLGKFMAEFKRASNEFKNQLESEMLNIELEERAKKQGENPQLLPPEEPWERLMRPISESVSRTKQELTAMVNPEPASAGTVTSDHVSTTSKSAGGQ
jgi:Tat protein translocase TatB subunit